MEVDTTPVAVSGHRRIDTLEGTEPLRFTARRPGCSRGEGESPTAVMTNLEGGKAKRATARSLA